MRLTENVKILDSARNARIKKESDHMHQKILRLYIFIICVIMIFMLIDIKIRTAKLLEKLEDLNNTLQYIDTRMDTLEFFRIPEKKK